jgi:hypothetical protein
MAITRKDLRNEADHLPATLADVIALRRRIIELGHSQAEAAGVVGWVIAKAAGEPDVTGAATRARYRKILAELDAPKPKRPRRARGDDGSTMPGVLLAPVVAAHNLRPEELASVMSSGRGVEWGGRLAA